MQGGPARALDSGKIGFIGIQRTKSLHEVLIDRILIQGRRLIAQQMMRESRLQSQRGEKVGAHFMRTENAFHAFYDVLDLVAAFFREHIEKLPGPSVQFAYIHPAAAQEVQPALIKTVEITLLLAQFFPATGPRTVAPCRMGLKALDDTAQPGGQKGQEKTFELLR